MVSKTPLKKDGFSNLANYFSDQGATYFSLILLDDEKNMLYYKSTNHKWQEKYVVNNYYKHCHLIDRTNQLIKSDQPSFTLAWDFVKCQNEIAAEINALRIENKIAHGVSFCQKNFRIGEKNATFLITLAGRDCDINFSENVVTRKKEIITSVIQSNVIQNHLKID